MELATRTCFHLDPGTSHIDDLSMKPVTLFTKLSKIST
jgi:hypothetical protein